MNQDTIDALHYRAKRIGHLFAKHVPAKGNDWGNYYGSDLIVEILGPDHIKFKTSNHNAIEFKGITPAKVSKEILHNPVTIGSTVVDAQSSIIRNASSADQSRTYSIEIGESKSFNEEVGVSVAIGISQKISVGNEASFVKGETELSLDIETTYNKAWGGATSESRTTETAVTVKPGKKVTVTTQRSTSKLEQKCEYWCDLEHSVRVYSHRDFDWTWTSFDEFKQLHKGLLPSNRPGHHLFKGKPWPAVDDGELNNRFPSTSIHYEHTLKFDKATTGDVDIKEEDL